MTMDYQPSLSLVSTPEEMGHMAALAVARLLKENRNAVLGLPTGGTAIYMYKELVRLYGEGKVDFSGAAFFNLDEYIGLPKDHPQSYAAYMQENLFKHVNAAPQNIFIPNGMALDTDQECRDYEARIQSKGKLDLLILGIGANGHIGFNEPGTSANTRTHKVILSDKTRADNARFFSDLASVPTEAITMGLQTIMDAQRILLLAHGEAKAKPIQHLLKGQATEDVPGSLLRCHRNVHLIIDAAAYPLTPSGTRGEYSNTCYPK